MKGKCLQCGRERELVSCNETKTMDICLNCEYHWHGNGLQKERC